MVRIMAKMKKSFSKRTTKQPKRAKLPQSKKPSRVKKVAGTVLKIVNGKPTNKRLSAEEAFGDLEQAREQVQYEERYGSTEEKRLARLAFRQYQNMRFRTK